MSRGFALLTAVAQKRGSTTYLKRACGLSLVMTQKPVRPELGGRPMTSQGSLSGLGASLDNCIHYPTEREITLSCRLSLDIASAVRKRVSPSELGCSS